MYKTINRGWLRNRVIAGQIIGRKTMSFNGMIDCSTKTGQKEDKPCFFARDISERQEGKVNIWEHDFRSSSGAAWQSNDGIIHLSSTGDCYELKLQA